MVGMKWVKEFRESVRLYHGRFESENQGVIDKGVCGRGSRILIFGVLKVSSINGCGPSKKKIPALNLPLFTYSLLSKVHFFY